MKIDTTAIDVLGETPLGKLLHMAKIVQEASLLQEQSYREGDWFAMWTAKLFSGKPPSPETDSVRYYARQLEDFIRALPAHRQALVVILVYVGRGDWADVEDLYELVDEASKIAAGEVTDKTAVIFDYLYEGAKMVLGKMPTVAHLQWDNRGGIF